MVEINGTYEPVSNENYVAYLSAFGIDEALATKIISSKTPIVITDVSDTQVTISVKDKPITFVFGVEKAYTLPTGHNIKSTLSRSGNKITFKSVLAEDSSVTEDKVYEFTDAGLTATSTNHKGGKGVFQYKRL